MIAFWIDCPRCTDVRPARFMWDDRDNVIGVRGDCGHIVLPIAD